MSSVAATVNDSGSSEGSGRKTSRGEDDESGLPPKTQRTETSTWSPERYRLVLNANVTEVPLSPSDPTAGDASVTILQLEGEKWPGVESDIGAGKLFGRPFYKKLFEDIADQKQRQIDKSVIQLRRYLLVGTPGIGKTVALNYLLYLTLKHAEQRMMKGQKPLWENVVLILPGEKAQVFWMEKQLMKTFPIDDALVTFLKESSTTLLLNDIGAPNSYNSKPPAIAVYASSPRRERYNFTISQYGAAEIIVPIPSDAEMEIMATHVFSDLTWKQYSDCQSRMIRRGLSVTPKDEKACDWRVVAQVFGNTPREVFQKVATNQLSTPLAQLSRVIKTLSVEQLRGITSDEGRVGASDWILRYISTDDFGNESSPYEPLYDYSPEFVFRSAVVEYMIMVHAVMQWPNQIDELLRGPLRQKVYEDVFHRYVRFSRQHMALALNPPDYLGKKVRHPANAAAPNAENELDEVWPQVDAVQPKYDLKIHNISTATVLIDLAKEAYYIPEKVNFALIDSFMVRQETHYIHLLMFQCTVTKTRHAPTESKICEFLKFLETKCQLNGKKIEKISLQSPTALDQPLQCTAGDTTLPLKLSLVYVVPATQLPFQAMAKDQSTGWTQADRDRAIAFFNTMDQWRYNWAGRASG